jgi:hypothetical protein
MADMPTSISKRIAIHHAPDQQQFLSLMPTDFGSMECPVYQIPDVQMSMPEQL